MGLLPNVAHFVNKSRENQLIGSPREYVRVQGQLVRGDLFDAAGEALRRKVSFGAGMALQRYENMGELPNSSVLKKL